MYKNVVSCSICQKGFLIQCVMQLFGSEYSNYYNYTIIIHSELMSVAQNTVSVFFPARVLGSLEWS